VYRGKVFQIPNNWGKRVVNAATTKIRTYISPLLKSWVYPWGLIKLTPPPVRFVLANCRHSFKLQSEARILISHWLRWAVIVKLALQCNTCLSINASYHLLYFGNTRGEVTCKLKRRERAEGSEQDIRFLFCPYVSAVHSAILSNQNISICSWSYISWITFNWNGMKKQRRRAF